VLALESVGAEAKNALSEPVAGGRWAGGLGGGVGEGAEAFARGLVRAEAKNALSEPVAGGRWAGSL
jgi:hypothetical protein